MKQCKFSYFILKLVLTFICVVGQSVAQSENTLTIDYCELTSNAATYDKKIVRVKGQYFVGFEASVFGHNKCDKNRAWLKYGDNFEKATNAEVLNKFNRLTDASPIKTKDGGISYPVKSVEVTWVVRFVGIKRSETFGGRTFTFGFGHMNAFDYELTVLEIEDVQELPEKK